MIELNKEAITVCPALSLQATLCPCVWHEVLHFLSCYKSVNNRNYFERKCHLEIFLLQSGFEKYKGISKFQQYEGHNQTLLVTAEVHLGTPKGDKLTDYGSMWFIFIFRIWSRAPFISTVWLFLFQNTTPFTAHNILYKRKEQTIQK